MSRTKVYVGMSGGVDSSLTAALLVEQGYDVTGVYMKNWTTDLPGMKCPWADDLADAKRVAVRLGIDFKVFDFENDYKHKVVEYMIDEYKNGRTPNPDIMCNQEVKFKLFLEAAIEDGADMIATGHYARVSYTGDLAFDSNERLRAETNKGPDSLLDSGCRCSFDSNTQSLDNKLSSITQSSNDVLAFEEPLETESDKASGPSSGAARSCSDKVETSIRQVKCLSGLLKRAVDDNKDQTYFLYRVTGKALARTLFPIGEFTKPVVRQMAADRGLVTAAKKDSQGICFVGQVGIREFLSQYVEQKPGDIIDRNSNKVLGRHDGAIFYTIGQRHGLDLGGGLPYYVVGKDMSKNEVYVTTDLNNNALWRQEIKLSQVHWINDGPIAGNYQIRIRHRATLIAADLSYDSDDVILKLSESERAIAAGQSVVVYDDQICLGGGIVL